MTNNNNDEIITVIKDGIAQGKAQRGLRRAVLHGDIDTAATHATFLANCGYGDEEIQAIVAVSPLEFDIHEIRTGIREMKTQIKKLAHLAKQNKPTSKES